VRAGFGNDSPFAVAAATGGHIDELAEYAALSPAYLAGAITGGALSGLAAWFASAPPADRADLCAYYLQFFLSAEDRLFEGDSEVLTQVGTLLRPRVPTCAAEEGIENVPNAAEVEALETTAAESLHSGVAKAVVSGAFLRVAEDIVGFFDLFELLLGSLVSIVVGMVLKCQLSERLLDFVIRGISVHAQNIVVVVFISHKPSNLNFRYSINYRPRLLHVQGTFSGDTYVILLMPK